MYTAKQPAPGTEAGPEHMHEQATRQQLTSLYEAENPPKAKTPQQPQQPPAPQQQEQQPQEQPQAPMGQQTAQNTTGGLMSDIIPSAHAEDRLAQNVFTQSAKGASKANSLSGMAQTANDVLSAAQKKNMRILKN